MERDQFIRYALPVSTVPDTTLWPPKEQNAGVPCETILPLLSASSYAVSIEPVVNEPACFVSPPVSVSNANSGEDQQEVQVSEDPAMCDFDMAFIVYPNAPVLGGRASNVNGPASVASPAGSTASTALSFSQQSGGRPSSGTSILQLQYVKMVVQFDGKYIFNLDLSALKGASVVPSTDEHEHDASGKIKNRKRPPSLVLRFQNCCLRVFPVIVNEKIIIPSHDVHKGDSHSQHQHQHGHAQCDQRDEPHNSESDGSMNSRNYDNLLHVLECLQNYVLKSDKYSIIFQDSNCQTPMKKSGERSSSAITKHEIDSTGGGVLFSNRLNDVFRDSNDRTENILKYARESLVQGLKRVYSDIDHSTNDLNAAFNIVEESNNLERKIEKNHHKELLMNMGQLLRSATTKSSSIHDEKIVLQEIDIIEGRVLNSSQMLEDSMSSLFPAPRSKQIKNNPEELKSLRSRADQLVQQYIMNVAQKHICSTMYDKKL